MSPDDVNPEWVEKATEAVAGEMPACGECGEYGPPRCVYCKDDAERYARHALAAVLPLAQAEALDGQARTDLYCRTDEDRLFDAADRLREGSES